MRGLRLGALLVLASSFAACAPSTKEVQRLPVARSFCLEHGFSRLGMGTVESPAPTPTVAHRVYAKARFVWIRKRPTPESEWIGYITLGQSLGLRQHVEPPAAGALTTSEGTLGIVGPGSVCQFWVPVEPSGWVCTGRDATLNAADPVVVELEQTAPDVNSPWPFDYARSLETPRYRSLPTMREQKATEGNVEALRTRIDAARAAKTREEIAAIDKRLTDASLDVATEPAPDLFLPPYTILESDAPLKLGSTIAFSKTFSHDQRSWLLSWDRAVIPMVRTRLYPRSGFHGVRLEDGVRLPLAFSKKQEAKHYARDSQGSFIAQELTFEPQALIQLADGAAGKEYLETTEPGVWVRRADVVVVEPKAELPKRLPSSGRRTWVEVSTVGGWLVAFEGEKPVYATMISAGRGETLANGTMRDSSSTPVGTYSIASKFRTATMRSERRPDIVHAEVMYTQVFFEDYALHGAPWHDEWGDRKSAGCVNLAPMDAKWVFDWSEPELPPDWHAKRSLAGDPTTVVVVHN